MAGVSFRSIEKSCQWGAYSTTTSTTTATAIGSTLGNITVLLQPGESGTSSGMQSDANVLQAVLGLQLEVLGVWQCAMGSRRWSSVLLVSTLGPLR